MIAIQRYHDVSFGHRVYGHENKCAHLHGHNYRFTFDVRPTQGLDGIGRVIDFSVIKTLLCEWLEQNWDHKMLIWENDPMSIILADADSKGLVVVPFNPTAENIAEHFLKRVAPRLLERRHCYLHRVEVEETRKCKAIAELEYSEAVNIKLFETIKNKTND